VKTWPDARYYWVMLDLEENLKNPSFLGKKAGTESFDNAVSQWAAIWAKHNREIGLKPGQLVLLILDEPGTRPSYSEFKFILDWAKAIKKGTDEIILFTDPQFIQSKKPWEVNFCAEALSYHDIISPPLDQWLGNQEMRDFYAGFQQKGKALWFYSCAGPTRSFDPVAYFRLQPWHCFTVGASGSAFWAYGDAGGGNSWNEYELKRYSESPVYIAPDSLTTSKHWEACREGVQDYQYLKMLQELESWSLSHALYGQHF